MNALVLGAVAYDAKVIPIWDGFKAYFESHGLPFDFVLYSNYERQVAAHLRGEIDLAWNSPLAWIMTRRAAPDRARAIAMRDTDRDLTSVVVVRAGPGEQGKAAGEAAAEVTDLAMRVCGGAAYRKDVGVERIFRDSRAALVMSPTTDILYDFIGKAVCGMPLF